jgi:DNA-binding transcriptional LysR family regulator
MIANFAKTDVGISVSLDITNRQQLLKQLEDLESDIVLMGEPPATMDVISEKLIPNPLVMISHPQHPLANQTKIPFALIAKYKFIVREQGSGTRATISRFFVQQGVEFNSTLEMGSNEAIKHAVTAGLGLGIVSLHTIKLELEAHKLVILDVEDFPIMRYWHLVRRTGKHLLPAVARFQDFILEEAKIYAKDYERFIKN